MMEDLTVSILDKLSPDDAVRTIDAMVADQYTQITSLQSLKSEYLRRAQQIGGTNDGQGQSVH